jgi:hypothetical protein
MSPRTHTPALTGGRLGASLAHCLCSVPNIRQLGGYLLGVQHYFAATLKGTLCYGGVYAAGGRSLLLGSLLCM